MEPLKNENNAERENTLDVKVTGKRSNFKREWVVVVAAFCVHIMHAMQVIFTSVILTDLAEHFRASATVLGTLAALRASVVKFSGVLVAPLVPVLGCRPVACLTILVCVVGNLASAFCHSLSLLTVFFAIISASGTGAIFIPTSVIVQQHFSGRQRALAAGVASAGLSLGSTMSGPLLRLIINWYGWRGSFIVLAAITLQMMVFTMLFFPAEASKMTSLPVEAACPDEAHAQKCGEDTPQNRGRACVGRLGRTLGLSLLKNRVYLIFMSAIFLLEWGASAYIYLGISRAVHQGVDVIGASFISLAFGPGSLLGRLAAGVVGSAACTNRKLLVACALAMAGLVEALSTLAGSSLALHLTFACLFGFFFGKQHSLYPTVLTDIVGTPSLSSAMGLMQLVNGIASLIGLQVVGWLTDYTGGYLVPFLSLGAVTMVGGLIALLMIPLAPRQDTNSDENNSDVT